MIARRLFLGGMLAAVTAPAIVRASSLMPVAKMIEPVMQTIITPHGIVTNHLRDINGRIGVLRTGPLPYEPSLTIDTYRW